MNIISLDIIEDKIGSTVRNIGLKEISMFVTDAI